MDTLTSIAPSPKRLQRTIPVIPGPAPAPVRSGYILLLLSSVLYGMCEYYNVKENLFLFFFLHYSTAIVYTFVLIFNSSFGIKRSWKKENTNRTVILLNLYLLSAFALNRELTVFENSVSWLCVYILLSSVTLLSFAYVDRLPLWVNNLQYFLLGTAITLYLYLALYVVNFYPVGSLGVIFFGIGGHIFVPLILLITSITLFLHFRTQRIHNISVAAGFLIPTFAAIAFTIEWNSRISNIERISNQSPLYENAELPSWLKIAEVLKNDWISDRIFKADLVFTTADTDFNEWRFMPQTFSWGEQKKHDPLVYLASLSSKITLASDERIKVLRAISDKRHLSNERLWSGDNLTTSYILSDIDIYADLRLTYTEQFFNIRNNSLRNASRTDTEEGIYTFYLSPGSVVTSLSLWINGKEEKAILTSRQKATKAYQTIVGVERRDPSVVHWQEGNTITVRVFPCTNDEERKFKIGITSPLHVQDGQVVYKNVLFDGPDPSDAAATTRIRYIGGDGTMGAPSNFLKNLKGEYISEERYDPNFTFSYRAAPVKSNHFNYNGYSYSVKEFQPGKVNVTIESVFLDINKSWTNTEVAELRTLLKDRQVFGSQDDQFVKLTDANWSAVTNAMKARNFSLFPFHKVQDTEHSLVVSKGNRLSPHLADIKESKFADGVNGFFAQGKKVRVFNITGARSTYIASLAELRGIDLCVGKVSHLQELLHEGIYTEAGENDDVVVLPEAGVKITRTSDSISPKGGDAPDHLARLFAYNNIMRKVGVSYFNDDYINESLVQEAATANVVSPVSSLIVLETQEDYKRFDIKKTGDGLQNAARESSGSVPEPHEWVLIIMFLVFALYMKVRNQSLQSPRQYL
ncbi:XrtN system VIT domain-containing protein [Flavitalea antarctica]